MKKTLAIAALCCAAMGMNAEVVATYDFNTTPSFFPYLQAPLEEGGMGQGDNFNFIQKDGSTVLEGAGEWSGKKIMDKAEDGTFVTLTTDLRISLADGCVYTKDAADGKYKFEGDEIDYTEPFIGWKDGGPTRTIWMKGWGTEDAWADANYNAIDADNWVATRHAIAFNRNDHSASRKATYIQFPEVQGPFTVTYYISSNSDSKQNKTQALRCRIVPVANDVELDEKADNIDIPHENIVDKRFYKKTYSYDGTDKVAFRIGANGAVMALYHVVVESGVSGIEDVIATPEADKNAPVYNILGQRVNENYKGLVIKNGVKYVQK